MLQMLSSSALAALTPRSLTFNYINQRYHEWELSYTFLDHLVVRCFSLYFSEAFSFDPANICAVMHV